MGKSLRQRLADAHHDGRELANKVHDLEKKHLPLESRIAELERDLDAARGALAQVPRFLACERDRLSDAELYALAAVVATEALPATPARARLLEELQARGAILTVEQAILLASVKRASGG